MTGGCVHFVAALLSAAFAPVLPRRTALRLRAAFA